MDFRNSVAWMVLAICLVLPSGRSTADEPSRPVALAEEPKRADRAGILHFRGGIALFDRDPGFGELSDIRILNGGAAFAAVTDRGFIVTGRLDYGSDGRLNAAGGLTVRPLPDLGPWPLNQLRRDAEALALLPDGSWVVGFELDHRVVVYPPGFGAEPRRLPIPPGIERLKLNGGIEALAAMPDGGLIAISESGDDDGHHPGWFWTFGKWQPFTYQAQTPFQPTAAAAFPNGDLLVLERRASWFGGLGARIVRVPAARLVPGTTVAGEELGRIDPPQIMENFEGIDLRTDPDGRVFLYLVSDDNQEPLFRTVILMFELPAD